MSTTPLRLPDRRPHELIEFDHNEIRCTLGIGRFSNGALAEIDGPALAISASKPKSQFSSVQFSSVQFRLQMGRMKLRPTSVYPRLWPKACLRSRWGGCRNCTLRPTS